MKSYSQQRSFFSSYSILTPFRGLELLRIVIIFGNEILLFKIITTTNLGENLALGLILNFTAGVIIVELDDIAMETLIAQKIKNLFSEEEYMKVTIPKKNHPLI